MSIEGNIENINESQEEGESFENLSGPLADRVRSEFNSSEQDRIYRFLTEMVGLDTKEIQNVDENTAHRIQGTLVDVAELKVKYDVDPESSGLNDDIESVKNLVRGESASEDES